MSTLSTVQSALDTKLQELVTGNSLACVLFGRRFDFTGFPSARYYLDGIENQLLSAGGAAAADYLRTVRFRIDVVQERSEKSPQQAETDLLTAVEATLAKLEDNWALGSAQDCLLAPFSSTVLEQQTATGILLIVPIFAAPRLFTSYT